ncbi:MAG: Uma2 family endonuclease [Candidatus Sumerlaeaceae bacterium]
MSVVVDTVSTYRAEDLVQPGMPYKCTELIEGELVVCEPAGKYHNRIASKFLFVFYEFCKSRPDLDYGNDNEGFVVQRNPDTLLSPDACLFRKRPETNSVWMEFAPEIAVEVLSPTNRRTEIAYKRQKYFGAGGEQMWIADPENQTLEICFRNGTRMLVEGEEVVNGEGIAEGMEICLREIFEKS